MDTKKEKSGNEFKERLYTFTLKLIQYIDTFPQDLVCRRIGDQLLRSGTSVLANYVEGYAASSKKDFTNFFNYSLKSANESKMWLELLRDTGKVSTESVQWFINEIDEIAKIFAASILRLRGKR